MIKHLLAPLIFTSLILTGCQSPQGKFTPEQVAAMQSYGFTESAGDWSLGLSDAILFAKNDYKLLPESQQQIQTMAAKLAPTGLTHARMDGHTDNYGEDSYNEVLSLKRANVVADAWAMGGQIPRSNLTTQGLGKKYPIASNKTAQGRAENRRDRERIAEADVIAFHHPVLFPRAPVLAHEGRAGGIERGHDVVNHVVHVDCGGVAGDDG